MEETQLDVESFFGDIDTLCDTTDFDELFSKHFHDLRLFKIRWDVAVGANYVYLRLSSLCD